jgi:hypothetical protein
MTTVPALCAQSSRDRDEPLTATASRVDRWLVVEHRGAWGPETFPSRRLGRALSTTLAHAANAARARLVLVRRPRVVPDGDGRWLYAVDSRPGRERVLARHVTDDAELAHLVAPFGDAPLDGRAPDGQVPDRWHEHEGPLYLVCTHGRHDRCCALRGRPVAQALGRVEPERTWECTHIGGDRFAANVVVLPEGLYLGRVEVDEVVDVVRGLEAGVLPAGRVRGRSSLSLPAQAAQQFARDDTGRWASADLHPVVQEGAGPDTWRVVLAGPGGPDVEVVVRFDRGGDGGEHLLTCGAADLKHAPVFRRVALVAAAR